MTFSQTLDRIDLFSPSKTSTLISFEWSQRWGKRGSRRIGTITRRIAERIGRDWIDTREILRITLRSGNRKSVSRTIRAYADSSTCSGHLSRNDDSSRSCSFLLQILFRDPPYSQKEIKNRANKSSEKQVQVFERVESGATIFFFFFNLLLFFFRLFVARSIGWRISTNRARIVGRDTRKILEREKDYRRKERLVAHPKKLRITIDLGSLGFLYERKKKKKRGN